MILRQAGADEAGFGILARWGYSSKVTEMIDEFFW